MLVIKLLLVSILLFTSSHSYGEQAVAIRKPADSKATDDSQVNKTEQVTSKAEQVTSKADPIAGKSEPVVSETEPSLVNLGLIDSDVSDKLSVVTIRLDRKPQWQKVYIEDHGQFLQIALPDTIVATPGQFIDGKGPFIAKIASYQTKPEQAMVRIFLKEPNPKIAEAAEAEVLGNRIVFTIDHSVLESIVALGVASEQKPVEQPKVPKIVKPKVQPASEPLPKNDLNGILQKISIFLAFFLLFVGFLMLAKRSLRERSFGSAGADVIKMKAISHLVLAPKHKLSLVQVGNEKILLSISPENIAFLAKIDNPGLNSLSGLSADDLQDRAAKIQSQAKKVIMQKKLETKKNIASTASQEVNHQEKTKRIPGKDENKKHSINIKIDESGINDETLTMTKHQSKSASEREAIKDVTELIKEKLKSLPKL